MEGGWYWLRKYYGGFYTTDVAPSTSITREVISQFNEHTLGKQSL
jgi:hypothetical protein